MSLEHFRPVIPAGGSGTRLWPASRRDRPKFLLPLLGPTSLLQDTVARLAPLAPPARQLVVAGVRHADAVRTQVPEVTLLLEPEPRDSAAAIALAAAVALAEDPDAVTGSFAADHVVTDRPAFELAVRTAIADAAQGRLVTIGITPTRPETGYGYIRLAGAPTGGAQPVQRFVEKPDQETAQTYLDAGDHLWNAGMFVWRADVFLAEVRRQLPVLHEGVTRIAAAHGGPDAAATLARIWPELPRISVDHGVIEGAAGRGLVSCVPAELGWTDVGDWATLARLRGSGTPALDVDSPGCLVWGGRPTVLLGVSDLIVADAGDVVLVCARDRAQDVGTIVPALAELGWGELT